MGVQDLYNGPQLLILANVVTQPLLPFFVLLQPDLYFGVAKVGQKIPEIGHQRPYTPGQRLAGEARSSGAGSV